MAYYQPNGTDATAEGATCWLQINKQFTEICEAVCDDGDVKATVVITHPGWASSATLQAPHPIADAKFDKQTYDAMRDSLACMINAAGPEERQTLIYALRDTLHTLMEITK